VNIRGTIGRLRDSLRQALRPDANSMVFRQTHVWSRAIIWTIIGVFVAVVVWACLAPMDEVVHAKGKLEPRGSVREVQSPVSGVVAEVLAKEGQSVSAGEPLLRLDQKVAAAEVRALEQQVESMQAEQSFYDSLFRRADSPSAPETLPPEVADLAKNHASLVAEDKLLRAILDSSADSSSLDPDQSALFAAELRDYEENLRRVQQQLKQAREVESKNADILARFRKLAESGGSSELEVMAREVQYIQSVARVKDLQAQEENLLTVFRKEVRTRLGENTKRIAEVEANLTRSRLGNAQRLSETEGRLAAARESLAYHEIVSPSDGVVFEIVSSKPGAVVGAKDVVLKIVPSGELVAEVDITNRDIGFISVGMPCEVEVDTFPKREFGFIEGEVYLVGSDVLPPSDVKPFYSFPAKVSLARQALGVRNKEIPLQSGMAVSVNIKIRKRLVVNLFLDNLLGPVEKMREVR
jgi:HlyD family secretion protein